MASDVCGEQTSLTAGTKIFYGVHSNADARFRTKVAMGARNLEKSRDFAIIERKRFTSFRPVEIASPFLAKPSVPSPILIKSRNNPEYESPSQSSDLR